MALHIRADFAKLLGKGNNYVSEYVKRGKLVMSGDYIDDTHPLNKLFMDRYFGRVQKEKKAPKPKESKAKVLKHGPPQIPKPPVPKVAAPDVTGKQLAALEELKSKLEVEKLEQTNRYLKIKADKATGVVIPTDLVKVLFLQHSRSITTSFRNALEDILVVLSTGYGLGPDNIADLRKTGVNAINLAVQSAVEQSKDDIQNIVNEYSEARGVGERL